MSHSLSITPAEKKIDLSIRLILGVIWGGLAIFGVLTVIQPQWLLDISQMGRESEAMDLKKMADNLMHESKLNEAVVLYEKAIETYPELTEATGNLAIAYARLGNTARAKKIILSMIDQIPGRAYVGYLNLGDIYREKEDYKQALEYYRQAVEGNPFPHDANKLIAFCLKQEGSLTEALKYYGKSLQFYSDFASLYSGSLQRDKFRFRNTPENLTKIEKLMKDDDHRKSLEPFDEEAFLFAASSNPEVAKIYNEMGTIYYELGKKELAEKAFRNALSVNPGYNNARRNLNMISRD